MGDTSSVQERVEDLFFYNSCVECCRVPESSIDDDMRQRIFEEDIIAFICEECSECDECCIC